ncbi:C40 family peptidase [Litchfieldia alkalitelluris]|uniref:C40 family peptidase n=1 Tax=Litchfieldia alkalitelluris TaxID=304268 RepID=UPI000998C9C2|nr:NlpC/P60 family protein [Litchfieldia alkalitelluris]
MKNNKFKSLRSAIIAILIFTLSLGGGLQAHAQVQKVPTAGIAINGKIVDGINPIIINGKYYLPFVQLSKILGYNNIKYEQGTGTYQITDGSTTVRMTMGGTRAKKSNEYINIEPPKWSNNTAFVSMNAAGALFNVYIYFKQENGSVQIQKPARKYVVQRGDTLWTISRAHHTTVQELKAANNLSTNLILIGQVLNIPGREKTHELEPIREKEPVPNDHHTKLKNQRQGVLNQAKKYIGAGYKFGATLADAPKLFDCSSFTQLVFQQNGITIPRVSRDQASKGTYVKELKAGDLMFFTNSDLYSDGRIGHVGIYMGDGSMIHASSSKGVSITENVLNNPYWGKNYLFSKRVIQ